MQMKARPGGWSERGKAADQRISEMIESGTLDLCQTNWRDLFLLRRYPIRPGIIPTTAFTSFVGMLDQSSLESCCFYATLQRRTTSMPAGNILARKHFGQESSPASFLGGRGILSSLFPMSNWHSSSAYVLVLQICWEKDTILHMSFQDLPASRT